MIVTSKNGLKLEIHPRKWWNLLDWFETLRFCWNIKNLKIHRNAKDWRFTYRSAK